MGWMQQGAGRVADPIWRGGGAMTQFVANLSAYFARKATLEEENANLKESLRELTFTTHLTQIVEAENVELRAALGRDTDKIHVVAGILAKPNFSPYDTFVIDLGALDGILPGQKVFAGQGALIGEVSSTYRHSALVSLFSTPGSEFQAYVGSTTIPITVKGQGSGNFRASVPRGTELSIGDVLVLPDLDTEVLGILQAIDAPENATFATLYFTFPFNYLALHHVYVEVPREKFD